MRDIQRIRELTWHMLQQAPSRQPPSALDDATSDATLEQLGAAGDWIRRRTNESGYLSPSADECRRLLATAAGRRLAADLAEDLDLLVLFAESPPEGATLEQARRVMRMRLLRGAAVVGAAPAASVVCAQVAASHAVPLRNDDGAPLVGKDALIALDVIDARVSADGALVALGHVYRASNGTTEPALLLVAETGVDAFRVDGCELESGQRSATIALVEARSYPAWPSLLHGATALDIGNTPGEVDVLALGALQALKLRRFNAAHAYIDGIGCGESTTLDALATVLRNAARDLQKDLDD